MIKKLSAVTMVVIITNILGCPQGPLKVTPQPPEVTDQAMCKEACDHIGPKGLNCDEGRPIDMKMSCKSDNDCNTNQSCNSSGRCEVSCERFCIDTENNGVWLDPVCVAHVKSCSEIDGCPAAIPVCSPNSCPVPETK